LAQIGHANLGYLAHLIIFDDHRGELSAIIAAITGDRSP